MAKKDYNIIVIGGGSAGLVSAYIASAVKAKVALVEKHRMGGDCLNTGCVPSKALLRTAKVLSYFKRHKDFGVKSAVATFGSSRQSLSQPPQWASAVRVSCSHPVESSPSQSA